MLQFFFGIVLASSIAGCSTLLSWILPNIGEVTIAILMGIVLGNLFKVQSVYQKGIEFSEKKLLSYAIILMGFGLNVNALKQIGIFSLFLLVFLIGLTIALGYFLARFFGLKPTMGTLIGTGNAICGSSAIAAVSPFLSPTKEEVGISIGVINLLGTVGIFALPLLIHFLQFNDAEASLLIGGSLQAVGHVVAAGHTVNEQVGDMSTAIKMARIFLLAPLLMVFAFFNSKSKEAGKPQNKFSALPFYLYGFVICAFLNYCFEIPKEILTLLQKSSHVLTVISMAAVGLQTKIRSLLSQGPKALSLGLGLSLVQVAVLILAIKIAHF